MSKTCRAASRRILPLFLYAITDTQTKKSDEMCTRPITHDGLTFACRICNACITARKNDWVARAMAESAVNDHTLVFALTYRNEDGGEKPDGAVAFKYADVEAFLKHLRETYYRRYGKRGEIRFICAGERGSNGTQRVHWHMVIWAKRSLVDLGEWTDHRRRPCGFRTDQRMHWTFWRHGYVYPQKPDQGGIAYVLKYALKDQFTELKSKDTMREANAEAHGASYFRMSKMPPIGMPYLERRCDRWEALRVVPRRLHIKVPDYTGYWWPKGAAREYLINRLWAINEKRKQEIGRECAQWQTLLASCVDDIKTWEGLVYGPQEETPQEFANDAWRVYLEKEQRVRARSRRVQQWRQRCGGVVVCRACWNGFDQTRRKEFRRWFEQQKAEYSAAQGPDKGSFRKWYAAKGQSNPRCTLHDADIDDRNSAFRA